VSDHILRPEHGLIQWCEGLVVVDSGHTLGILAVSVDRRKFAEINNKKGLLFYYRLRDLLMKFRVLNPFDNN
jgi:hypothetical protein